MALVATLDRSRSTHLRILEVKQLLCDISSSDDQSRNSFDEAVYSHILKKLNSAIMRSPQGEEACSELLKIVDKLEARLFGEVEQGGGELGHEYEYDDHYSRRRAAGYSGVRPVFGVCDCCQGEFEEPSWQSSDGDVRGVFSQQHPTSPVSGQCQSFRSPAQRSVSTSSTEEFNSPLQDSFYSPQASVAWGCPLNSDPPRKSEVSSIGCKSKSHDDLDNGNFVFGRTARKLEISFMECAKPRGVLQKLAAVGKRSTSARELRHSLFNSWGSGKSAGSTGSPLNASKASATRRLQKGVHGQRHSPFKVEAGVVPEIACKPLMLVSKASRHRLPGVESNAEQQCTVPHLSKLRTSMASTLNQVVTGSLQCVLTNGLVTYNLWLDETEELLVAKPVVQDYSEDQEVYDKVFSIFSHKFRGRGRAGWVHWGKKDKPVVEMLGKLKVLSTVIPEMDLGGKHRHFVDSDFVLLEARPQPKTVSSPFSSSGRKMSFSSWDATTTTPSESPRCTSFSSESPMFGLPQASPRKTEKPKTPVKWPSMSFLRPRNDAVDYQDVVEPDCPSPNFVEVAAMVTRNPIELKKSTQIKAQDQQQRQHQAKDTWESRLKRNNRSCKDSSKLPEDMNVTVVLPTGDHGCPASGLAGPQPLLDRWRSGGSCDCGSWDLGCGLVVLANQQSTRCSAKAAQEQAGCISIVVQGKSQKAALKLSPLFDDDTYRVSFQQPLSALQAVGTAVAVLHSSRTKDRKSVVDDAIAQPRQQAADEEVVSTLTRHRRSGNNRSRG